MIWVGILGAKGYFGEALERMVAGHPEAQLSTVMELRGLNDGDAYMCGNAEKRSGYWNMVNAIRKSDIIFSGLSGEIAGDVYSKALSYGKRVIDISGELSFAARLKESGGNTCPGSVYGLSELYKDSMKKAAIASNPSSYCTGALLGLAPLAANNLADMDTAYIESKSGISSLRRNDRLIETGKTDKDGIKVYKADCMEYAEEVNGQMLALFGKSSSVPFESYIIPGVKGISTTIRVNSNSGLNGSGILDAFRDFYRANPFVEISSSGKMPEIKKGFNKCFCKIGASVEAGSGKITVTTVLDDASRGAAGQAIQTMNLMCGIDGKIGL